MKITYKVVGLVTVGNHQLLTLSHGSSGTGTQIRATKIDEFPVGSDVVVTIEPAAAAKVIVAPKVPEAKPVADAPPPLPPPPPPVGGFVAVPSPVSQVESYLDVLL